MSGVVAVCPTVARGTIALCIDGVAWLMLLSVTTFPFVVAYAVSCDQLMMRDACIMTMPWMAVVVSIIMYPLLKPSACGVRHAHANTIEKA